MRQLLKSSWFLISLVAVLTLGVGLAPALAAAVTAMPRLAIIAAIMLVTTLPIDFGRVSAGRQAWGAVAIAVAINAGLAAPVGWLAGLALPPELAVGMVIALASPCTVASAAVWTRRGGGNDAVAVLVTLITSIGSFVVLPFWALALLGQSIEVPTGDLASKLALCVMAPIAFAQLLRRAPGVADWATRQKPTLSLASQLGVLTMAFIGAVDAGVRMRSMASPIAPSDWTLLIAVAAAAHLVLLFAGWWGAVRLGIARPEAVAVAIAGSQKTLAVGIGIALEFGGLAIFPMIAYHMLQLLIDTLFVDRVRSTTD